MDQSLLNKFYQNNLSKDDIVNIVRYHVRSGILYYIDNLLYNLDVEKVNPTLLLEMITTIKSEHNVKNLAMWTYFIDQVKDKHPSIKQRLRWALGQYP